jgi:hypothetical protein
METEIAIETRLNPVHWKKNKKKLRIQIPNTAAARSLVIVLAPFKARTSYRSKT